LNLLFSKPGLLNFKKEEGNLEMGRARGSRSEVEIDNDDNEDVGGGGANAGVEEDDDEDEEEVGKKRRSSKRGVSSSSSSSSSSSKYVDDSDEEGEEGRGRSGRRGRGQSGSSSSSSSSSSSGSRSSRQTEDIVDFEQWLTETLQGRVFKLKTEDLQSKRALQAMKSQFTVSEKKERQWDETTEDAKKHIVRITTRLLLYKGTKKSVLNRLQVIAELKKANDSYGAFVSHALREASQKLYGLFGYILVAGKLKRRCILVQDTTTHNTHHTHTHITPTRI